MPSIFRKECPQCAAPNDVTAVRCRCGYCFDPDALTAEDAAEYHDEQQRLYRDYLEARLVQAEASAIAARDEADAEPANAFKKAQALLAEQEVGNVRAELAQYPVLPPKPKRQPTTSVAPQAAAKRPVTPVLSAQVRATVARMAVTKKSAPAPAKSELVIARAPADNTPTEAFRELQAAKAALAVSAQPQSRFKRAEVNKPAATTTSTPSAKPKAMPAKQECPVCTASVPMNAGACGCGYVFDRAAADMPAIGLSASSPAPRPAADAKQECPNCTATLPPSAKRCGCGYVFAQASSEMPGVSLDSGSLAILNNGLRRR
jgi:hypothetical protein